ncbi:MAG: hypothetical protein M1820_000339 [Bogoriella megaspora]|nr:MAG: hypothetical protein M1820_000339 [Bogoriella megaspora]
MAHPSIGVAVLPHLRDRSNSRSTSSDPPTAITQNRNELPCQTSTKTRSSLCTPTHEETLDEQGASSDQPNWSSNDGIDDLGLRLQTEDSILAVTLKVNSSVKQPIRSVGSSRQTTGHFVNRPYGRPLSTILEQSSYATLRSRLSRSSLQRRFTPIHIDPESKYIHTEFAPKQDARRIRAFSLDEEALQLSPPPIKYHSSHEQSSSAPTSRPSLEKHIRPSTPPFSPPVRIETPKGFPRWPNDEQTNTAFGTSGRRRNPFRALSGYLRRVSTSNVDMRQRIWRSMPGTATPGFDRLESHPFHAASQFETEGLSAYQSMSRLMSRSPVQRRPLSPRPITHSSHRRAASNVSGSASLPRSLEIRNDRRAMASDEAAIDNMASPGQLISQFPSPPESPRQSTDIPTNMGITSPLLSVAEVEQTTRTPEGGVQDAFLDPSEEPVRTLAAYLKAQPRMPSRCAQKKRIGRHLKRQSPSNQGSSRIASPAVRGDLEQRYTRSGVPIYRRDAASDNTTGSTHAALGTTEPYGDEEEHEHLAQPQSPNRPLTTIFSSPNSETPSPLRTAAVASTSSRHLCANPAITDARRSRQPIASTPFLQHRGSLENDMEDSTDGARPSLGTRSIRQSTDGRQPLMEQAVKKRSSTAKIKKTCNRAFGRAWRHVLCRVKVAKKSSGRIDESHQNL